MTRHLSQQSDVVTLAEFQLPQPGSHYLLALGRNPEAENAIRVNMILGIAFAEAIAIYALIVGIIIAFVI